MGGEKLHLGGENAAQSPGIGLPLRQVDAGGQDPVAGWRWDEHATAVGQRHTCRPVHAAAGGQAQRVGNGVHVAGTDRVPAGLVAKALAGDRRVRRRKRRWLGGGLSQQMFHRRPDGGGIGAGREVDLGTGGGPTAGEQAQLQPPAVLFQDPDAPLRVVLGRLHPDDGPAEPFPSLLVVAPHQIQLIDVGEDLPGMSARPVQRRRHQQADLAWSGVRRRGHAETAAPFRRDKPPPPELVYLSFPEHLRLQGPLPAEPSTHSCTVY